MDCPFALEICVYSVEDAIAAQQGGAHRVELCDNRLEGGTTPSAAAIGLTREYVGIDLHVIVRPRGGDFYYSETEFRTMIRDIGVAQSLGANGVVLGILHPDGNVDIKRTSWLVQAAQPMSVTFHRAFDMTPDPLCALEDVIAAGAGRILTSGQAARAIDGSETLASLVRQAGDRIIIMPGSGINSGNILELLHRTGAREFHMSAGRQTGSLMKYHNPMVRMGNDTGVDEYSRRITDRKEVNRTVRLLREHFRQSG